MKQSTFIQAIIHKQRSFFASGETKSIIFRTQCLKALLQNLIINETAIIDALHKDLKKPTFESYISELYLVKQELRYAIKHITRWTKICRVPTPIPLYPASSYLHPEPRGIVLIISPWNYPLQLTLIPLIGALTAGNCAIIKPSEFAPHTAHIISKIIIDTFNPAHIAAIEGNVEIAQELLTHTFDYIFFTGSTRIGKIVMHAAAEHLTPLTLELGGKSPCIVDQNASIHCTAKRIIWGKFLNAGQNCISPDYVLVHHAIKNTLIAHMQSWITTFYGTDPMQSTDYARIVNEHHFDRLSELLSQGTIVHGGQTNRENLYIAPTIIDSVHLDQPIMHEEIFGPILPVIAYDSIEHALEFVNNKPKPLALYIFSSDKNIQQTIIHRTSAGSMCINDTVLQASTPYLPFGGIGLSGFGQYHGKASFDTFSQYKTILHNSCRLDLPLRYPPYGLLHRIIKKLFR